MIQGDMKELRNQVFVYFKHVNRPYKDHHLGNTLIHMICQEGYFPMLNYLINPANRNDTDMNELEFSPPNERERTPLFLCFTPPTATVRLFNYIHLMILFYLAIFQFNGLKSGVDQDGNVKAVKPEEIEQLTDWCKPGGPKSRENCVKLLLENGVDPNQKDFHDFTALHYASIWGMFVCIVLNWKFRVNCIFPLGWVSTVKLLINHGADVNAATVSGRTALMFAVEFGHESLVFWLASKANSLGLNLDATDAEGFSALILAVEKKDDGLEMVKILLQNGCDPNIQTLRRKTALKISCQSQNLTVVNLLLDYDVQRRNSAFNLLKEENFVIIQARMNEDEKRIQEEAAKAEREKEERERFALSEKAQRKNPSEAWVEYRDKRTKKPFYYNTVTRKSTFDKPKNFRPDRKRIIKEVTFGMSFYH